MAISNNASVDVFGAALTRRQMVKAGGSLLVIAELIGTGAGAKSVRAGSANTLDATRPKSWIEIHSDNTILIRTGKTDFGQGSTFTAYRQIVAEELNAPLEAITTVVMGDTDCTPDGSGAFDFLGQGMPNIRKVAAYTYQALLNLASERLGAPRSGIAAKDGVVSGGGKSMTYGELVTGRQLKLAIPVSGSLTGIMGLTVTGNPPMKPVGEYTIIGKSYRNSAIASKVAAREKWVTDVRLPGMLHARMVHPKTLGSKLVSAGALDKARYPNAQVVVKGDLVGVVAPTEWEAVRAAQQVAAATTWTDWKGLPGTANLFGFLSDAADWKTAPVTNKSKGDFASARRGAAKTLSARYEIPFWKHAPIGPAVAVADVRPDGRVDLYTHTQNPQMLRGEIAQMLNSSLDKVIIRTFPGAGHYGRSNGGNAGAEDEAVILSKALGRPVRVQWMRPDEYQWSTQSPAAAAEVDIGLDADGKVTAYKVDHYMPAMQDDRPIGAVLAGLPTMPAPDFPANNLLDPFVYDEIAAVSERGHGTSQLGQKTSPLAVGMRNHSLRTPGQFQQNFPRELAMSEAAALAGADAIQFRLDHVRDERMTGVLKAVREASGWQTRSSPQPQPLSAGDAPARGRGVSVIVRSGTYWACVCEIAVVPSTGVISVEKYTIAVDPGIVVNPMQLKRQVEGGAVMGISIALLEELTFDESAITARDWRTYPIITMADVPEIKVVLLNRPEVGRYGGGSEAANALAAPAIAAALHDATGKIARRLPLKPDYVRTLLHV